MNVEDFDYDARKIYDFKNEDQQSEINDSWFAHHEAHPLIYQQATEEEFKTLLPTTPGREERVRGYHNDPEVEYGRNSGHIAEQEVVPIAEAAREEEEQRVRSFTIQKSNITATATAKKDIKKNTGILPENIKLKPSKATQPPRVKHQSVFDRLRAHTAASAGKMSKQIAIQKKKPALHTNKTLKKKMVLQERQQTKMTTKKSQGTAKQPIQKAAPVKAFTPHTITTTATTTAPKKIPSSKLPRCMQTTTAPKKRPSSKLPHYMQTTTSSQNKLRQAATTNTAIKSSESTIIRSGIKRQKSESSIKEAIHHDAKKMRTK